MMVIPREQNRVNIHTNSHYLRELRQTLSLSEVQKSVLSGTLMGDGCIIPTASGKNYRLQIEHGDRQKEYVFWKYGIFKRFVVSRPKYIAVLNSWRFRTISHHEFIQLRRIFYRDGKKILPKKLDFLLDPLTLAVWFMDDGCLAREHGYILNTQNFKLEDNVRLMKFLQNSFGLHFAIHRDRKYYRLFVKKQSMIEFRNLFKFRMQPIMRYKL